MVIDTSAIIEALIGGPRASSIEAKLKDPKARFLTVPTVVYEATVVLATKMNIAVPDAEQIVRDFLIELEVSVEPITDQTAKLAVDAFSRYGKGRHPARLNFGDCFSYAGAKGAQVPLLYVGQDFAQTDLA